MIMFPILVTADIADAVHIKVGMMADGILAGVAEIVAVQVLVLGDILGSAGVGAGRAVPVIAGIGGPPLLKSVGMGLVEPAADIANAAIDNLINSFFIG